MLSKGRQLFSFVWLTFAIILIGLNVMSVTSYGSIGEEQEVVCHANRKGYILF